MGELFVQEADPLETLAIRAAEIMRRPGSDFWTFKEMFDDLDPEALAALSLAALARGAEQGNAESMNEDYVYLHRFGDFNLQMKLVGFDHPGPELSAGEFDLIMTNISTSSLAVPSYATGIERGEVARRPPVLSDCEWMILEPRKPVGVPAFERILDFPRMAQPGVLLVLHSKAQGPVTWVYDRGSKAPKHLTSTNLQASRMELAARMLGAMGDARDAASLHALATSQEAGFVRWSAAEALYEVDSDAGLALLREHLVRDADPSVRRAALATLGQDAAPGAAA